MTDLYIKQGRRYIPTTLAQQGAWGWHNLMVVSAFRYCLGRMTYISRVCADWIIARWPDFPPNVQQLIRRELEEAFKKDDEDRADPGNRFFKELGWDCDRKEWERVRAMWASSPPLAPTAPSLDEIRHRAKWLAKEMNNVGEELASATAGEWGSDPRHTGLDLQDMAGDLLACIQRPSSAAAVGSRLQRSVRRHTIERN